MRRILLLGLWLLLPAARVAAGSATNDEARVLTDKTLVAWVAPANYQARRQGVLMLDNLGGGFDSIILSEIKPGAWMAGSDWFRRTERDQKDWPAESAPTGTLVQIAITYQSRTPSNLAVTITRNAEPYARYEIAGPPLEFGIGGLVGIGMANFDMGGRNFAGQVDDVRVYDAALSAEEIAALKPNRPSGRQPWAWWNFENGKIEDVTGRFESLAFGEPRVADGRLVFDGKDDAVLGLRGAAAPGLPVPAPAPDQYSFVYSAGYGQQNFYPTNLVKFEELIVNLREGGFNAIHCIYRPEYVEICRKHGMKIMLDVLAWLPPVEQDARRPRQQATVLDICRRVRGDDTIWGYNLWNERLDRYAPGNTATLGGLILLLRKWDPTHPIWVGTYMTWWLGDALYFKPGCPAYYDYHWERGLKWHFNNLPAFARYAAQGDGYFGRWMRNLDYNRSAYTMNTSIAFGLKTGIWFINGPWHPREPDVFKKDDFLCRIGRDHQRLWPEIGRIGRPLNVYSTPTTKAMDGKDKPAGVPAGSPIPAAFPLQVKSGEALLGHFRYPDGTDALYVANHNAYATQAMAIAVQNGFALEKLDRVTGAWAPLEPKGGAVGFPLQPGGGELLRVGGGKLPQ